MLDQHGRMADHARDQHLVLRQLGIPPDLPLVLVARVRRFERIGAGVDLQNEIEQVLDLHVVHARPHVDAVAGVVADFLRRDAAQRVVEHVDAGARPFAAFGDAGVGLHQVIGDEARIVDLQKEARVDDRLVFLAHRLGDGDDILLLRLVIGVALPLLDVGGRDRRHERLDLGAVDRSFQVGDVALQLRMALVGDRPGADHAVLPGADVDRRVELGEGDRLARADPRAAPRRLAVHLEAAEPLVDVGDEARLGVFAVVDDVDAELDLLLPRCP